MAERALRVGIDARAVSYAKTGDRSYALGLVDGLARLMEQERASLKVTLFFDCEPPGDLPCMREGELLPGWRTQVLPSTNSRLWTLVLLPQAARELDLDVLHVQYNGPRTTHPALVTTVHDISFRLFPEWFPLKDRLVLDLGLRSTFSVARSVLTGSECTRVDLERVYGLPPERIAVAPYALTPGFGAPEAGVVEEVLARHDVTRPYVLFVGVRQPRKNLPRAIAAFRRVRRQSGLPHRLVLAGKRGWQADETERAIEAAGEDVQPLGYVPDADLPALYAGAEAFLFPSLYEGFGLPVLEAFACGTPVIAGNVSAMPEVAGDAALLVDPRDEGQIAEALLRLLGDGELRATLAERGRARLREFDWLETARATVGAYRQAVEGT